VSAEVSLGVSPVADSLGDAGDELADAGLALGRVELAVEILAGDDVCGRHRPVLGDLDVFLLEDHVALGVGDLSGTEFPFDFVVGRDARLREEATEGEAGGLLLRGRARYGGRSGGGLGYGLGFGHQGTLLIRFYGSEPGSGVLGDGESG